MSRWKLPSGKIVQDDTPFVIEQLVTVGEEQELQSVQFYGVRDMSAQQRTDLGITEIVEQPRPDDRYGFVNEDPENPGAWIVVPFPTEMLKDRLIAYSKDKRWQRETGGFDWNGIRIATDDRSKTMIVGGRLAAQADAGWSTQWAVGDSAVTLTAAQMIALSDAVQEHVNQTFIAWDDVVQQINDGSIATYEAIDAALAPL